MTVYAEVGQGKARQALIMRPMGKRTTNFREARQRRERLSPRAHDTDVMTDAPRPAHLCRDAEARQTEPIRTKGRAGQADRAEQSRHKDVQTRRSR